MTLQIEPLSYAMGAQVIGVDFSKPIDKTTKNEIHAAFLKYCLLLFRGQTITREQHIAFTRLFGEVDINDKNVVFKDNQYPEILVTNPKPTDVFSGTRQAEAKGKQWYSGMVWHSDRAFSLPPTAASLLRGVKVPKLGGNTMFANCYMAYDDLSDRMKKLIEGLYCIYPRGESYLDLSSAERLEATKKATPNVAQPLVRVHPETGRKSLFIGERVKKFDGMSVEESEPLARYLFNHCIRPQFIYRHSWQQDDLLMWDNRCTLHLAVGDYDRTQTRHMEKTAVVGEPSGGYVYDGPMW